MNLGVLLKLDYHDNITPNCAFRGRSRLSTADVVKLYNGVHVPYGYRERHMKALVDMFSMPEGCLVANLVQYFHDNHTEFSNRAVAEVSVRVSVFP